MSIVEIQKELKPLGSRFDTYEILKDLFEFGALSLSNATEFNEEIYKKREEQYQQLLKKYSTEEMEHFSKAFAYIVEMYQQNDMGDYLGELYMQSLTSSQLKGQFFTPYPVCKIMAETQIKEFLDRAVIVIGEPSCGSGAMIIAQIDVLKNIYKRDVSTSILIKCGDLDRRCVCMTFIALSLLNVPAIIEQKNALSGKLYDRFETFAYKSQYIKFKDL